MPRVLACPSILALLFAGSTGCVHRSAKEVVAVTDSTADEPASSVREVREVVVADDDAAVAIAEPVASPVHASPGIHPRGDPVLFRLGAGYGALGRVDLAPCRERGLQPGYLHMRVTFRSSGRVVRAAVESSVAPPNEALACIGEQLETSMIPGFEGGDVTLSKSVFVNERGPGQPAESPPSTAE